MNIQENKERFLSLVNSINREGMKKEDLIDYLENSDFFTCPASAKGHASYDGGLVQHCLNVYDNLVMLLWKKGFIWKEQTGEEEVKSIDANGNETITKTPIYEVKYKYSPDTVKIVALFHDFDKCNHYAITAKNVKEYHEHGSKKDAGGNYDWVVKQGWQVKPERERLLYGNHEENSEFRTRQFIPLEFEESIAILNHMGSLGWDSVKTGSLSAIYNEYSLAFLLHAADCLATFIDERF